MIHIVLWLVLWLLLGCPNAKLFMNHVASDFDLYDANLNIKRGSLESAVKVSSYSQAAFEEHEDKVGDILTYQQLSSSRNGRHLLLLSLLDEIHKPYWYPRSDGFIMLFLPQSLAPVDQPLPVATGQLLLGVRDVDGRRLTRQQVVNMFNEQENFYLLENSFSRFNQFHLAVVKRLVIMFTTLFDFDSMLSMLVLSKEFLSDDIFVDSVYSVIQLSEDVGFIIPNVATVQPRDYIPGALMDEILRTGNISSGGRVRRQLSNYVEGGEYEMNWDHKLYRTLPDSEPDSRLWYFNEDPLINANHFHWHQILSNSEALSHTSHSSNLDRRGEMFYFMHRQMLCRYNAERLSVGLEVTKPYGPEQWARPFYPGYDPKLGTGAVARYKARPAGATMFRSDQQQLKRDLNMVQSAIDQMSLRLGNRRVRMKYKKGVDMGISHLGDVVESYVASKYGDLHNGGHTIIASLDKSGGGGVMGSPNVAIRDPIFSRWHKFIDDVFQGYKKNLGFYKDVDLDFPGVSLSNFAIQSDYYNVSNSLATYFNHKASLKLNSLDFKFENSKSVRVKYTRLDNVPFTYSITAMATIPERGMLRIFLIPASVKQSEHVDITQLAIEMDRFHVTLAKGFNNITRHSTESSFVAKQSLSLWELQYQLRSKNISTEEFNWSGCGWPKEMALPRGNEVGMQFQVLAVLSPLLRSDKAASADWDRMENSSWSWCGVRTDMGGMPDSRPMGFPLDRPPSHNTWQSLLWRDDGSRRSNIQYQNVTITFFADPWGLAKDNPR